MVWFVLPDKNKSCAYRMDPYLLHSLLARFKFLSFPPLHLDSGKAIFFSQQSRGLEFCIYNRSIWILSWLWQAEKEAPRVASGQWFLCLIQPDSLLSEMASTWLQIFDSICIWQQWLGLSGSFWLPWKHRGCALYNGSMYKVPLAFTHISQQIFLALSNSNSHIVQEIFSGFKPCGCLQLIPFYLTLR